MDTNKVISGLKRLKEKNVLPIDISPVKIKEYLNDGMSNNLLPLKVNYPKMVDIKLH